MAKSSQRDRTEGVLDRIGGRLLEMFGTLTGRKRHKAKGKAARLRGSTRSRKGRAKRGLRRATR